MFHHRPRRSAQSMKICFSPLLGVMRISNWTSLKATKATMAATAMVKRWMMFAMYTA